MREIPLPSSAGWKEASPPSQPPLSPGLPEGPLFLRPDDYPVHPTIFTLSDSIANTLGGKKTRSVDAWSPGTFNFSQLGDSVGDTMGFGELGFWLVFIQMYRKI